MDEKKGLGAFSIKKVKEFNFIINESLFEQNKPVKIQFQHSTKFMGESNFVDMALRVYYSYDSNIPPESILLDFHVQNVFEVPNLGQYLVDNNYILPENLIISIVSLSISHTRALMARNIAGTVYQGNIIPVVNPIEVTKAFFPNMFTQNSEQEKKVGLPPIKKVNNLSTKNLMPVKKPRKK